MKRLSTLLILATLTAGSPVQAQSGDTIKSATQQAPKDKIFTQVETDAEFPGGTPAWLRYLNRNLRAPDDSNTLPCTIVVQFIVAADGTISQVKAISGPTTGGLREEVVRVIKKSGKWTPAIQNDRHVKSLKKIPITIEFARE